MLFVAFCKYVTVFLIGVLSAIGKTQIAPPLRFC